MQLKGTETLNLMALSITTFSITTLSKMKHWFRHLA